MQAQPNYDLSAAALKLAGTITLADLLQNPVTECWTVSMIGNALRSAALSPELGTEQEDAQMMRLFKVNGLIDGDHRQECFRECGALINQFRSIEPGFNGGTR